MARYLSSGRLGAEGEKRVGRSIAKILTRGLRVCTMLLRASKSDGELPGARKNFQNGM